MRRLRLQLLITLLLVALLPAIPAALVVRGLLVRTLKPWADDAVPEGLRAGLETSRERLELEKERFARRIALGEPIETVSVSLQAGLDPEVRAVLAGLRPGEIESARLPVVDGGFALVAAVGRPAVPTSSAAAPNADRPIYLYTPLPAGLESRAGAMSAALQLHELIRRERGGLVRGLLLTFVAVYGALLVVVATGGIVLASRLTVPLEALARGIDAVSRGERGGFGPRRARGEIGRLLGRFDGMVDRLREQEESLVRLERVAAWRGMARRLAHEIKNPLTPIQLAAQEIRDAVREARPDAPSMVEEGTRIITEEVVRLRGLASEFSAFARLPEPRPRRIAVAAMLEDLSSLYGPERLAIESGGPVLEAWCDPEQVHRVLVNLINNAWTAQESVGEAQPVRLRASRGPDADDEVRLEVFDRGPGIRPELRDRIFDPDFTTRSEGMGLGLAIVREIVTAHAGRCEVGDRPDGGAVFIVHLPGENAHETDRPDHR